RNAARPRSHDDTSEGKCDPSNWPKIPDAMIEPMVRLETADRKARAAFGGFRGQIKQNGPSARLECPAPSPSRCFYSAPAWPHYNFGVPSGTEAFHPTPQTDLN